MDVLMEYPWPGNVRELVNAIEYGLVMAKDSQILTTDLPEVIQGKMSAPQLQEGESLSLRDTERELIVRTLKECRGNKHLTAKMLRIPRSTLYSKIQKHGIVVDEKSVSAPRERGKYDNTELAAVQN
jgi:DNA-binding NtrC family response regulator